MPNVTLEAAAIEAAYEAHVQMLFRNLVGNLIDGSVSGQTERQSLARFVAGLDKAKRAKLLALGVVVPELGDDGSRRTRLGALGKRKGKQR